MIVARGHDEEGRPVVLLGISKENVRRLQLNQPIDVPQKSLHSCALEGLRVLIVYAETTEDLVAQITPLMNQPNGPTGKPS